MILKETYLTFVDRIEWYQFFYVLLYILRDDLASDATQSVVPK